MNLKVLIAALRAGQELPHTTGVKWSGIAVTAVSLVLTALSGLALSRGWIQADIPPEQIYELSSILVCVVLVALGYIQAATTPRVGLLPPDRHDPPAGRPDERLRGDELSPDTDDQSQSAAQSGRPSAQRKRKPIVDGPFGF